MRKWIGILVCLLVSCQLFAVSYQPCKATSFRTTSAYVVPMQHTSLSMNMQRPLTTGSLSAISASNFETLNGEGGACYSPNYANKGPRRGRGDEDAIGEYDPHSPVGDVPCILMAIMASLYVIWTKKRKKVQKNLVVS